MKYIEQLLDKLETIEPLSTGVAPEVHPDNQIKCVIFDIYGTLLISDSGDIDMAEISTKNLEEALTASNIELTSRSQENLREILTDFENVIRLIHDEARKNDVPFPEIDILSIWEIVLILARRKNLIRFNGDANIMQMTCIFEFLSNRVFPMPGMLSTIQKLHDMGFPLGIVSNAQFYTPVLMNYFINRELSLNEKIPYFDPELTIYSYKLGIGKPDIRLFEELKPTLHSKYSLRPEQVLFVGNDMLKDIYTSKCAGFKAALFAGDKRSLRLHETDKRVQSVKPDYIVTELKQLFTIIQPL